MRPRLCDGTPCDTARVWSTPDLPGVEVHRRDGVTQVAPRHFHDQFVVGEVLAGSAVVDVGGRRGVAAAGDVVLLNPGEVHFTGPARHDASFSYRVAYLDPGLVREAARELRPRSAEPFALRRAVVADPVLAARLGRLHRAIARPATQLERETRLVLLLARLATRHAEHEASTRRCGSFLGRVKDFLAAHCRDDVSLADVAHEAGLTAGEVVRAFRAEMGISPPAFQQRCRLLRARDRIAAGAAPSEAADEAGFPDYGVFCGIFHRVFGVWPDAYARGVQGTGARRSTPFDRSRP